jgi:DNA (cytosine-5)-methyltransferase 1
MVAPTIDTNEGERRLLTSLELCAGAGGQALGLEEAGFDHAALVEIEHVACQTLKQNRPAWPVVRADLRDFDARRLCGRVDLLAGGVPCPPFTVAGHRLGADDERDLFPEMIRIARECEPRAVFIENVPGLLEARFSGYRNEIRAAFAKLGYVADWAKLNASDFGVPQLRPRALMVALPAAAFARFAWPEPSPKPPPTVGEALHAAMASAGWKGADRWAKKANAIGPTLVGGSKKHGGPDLGPTRARKSWAGLGVDGAVLADAPPPRGFHGMPRLTVQMAAIIQGFPSSWEIAGRKTNAYRQVGNAFPPPVAAAVATKLREVLEGDDEKVA